MGRGSKKPAAAKKPLTHFLCLPLVTDASRPQLERSLKEFTDAVSSDTDEEKANLHDNAMKGMNLALPAIPAKAIRPIATLHCTLGVMSLEQEELKEAIECLMALDIASLMRRRDCDTHETAHTTSNGHTTVETPVSVVPPTATSAGEEPLKVDLKGLESMHAPDKTSILYSAPIDSSDRLYPFCLAVQKLFKDKRFLLEDDRQLKLHATIVNTIYAKGRKREAPRNTAVMPQASVAAEVRREGHGARTNAPPKIDARPVLQQFKNFIWAQDVVLDRLAICEMGAKKAFDAGGNVVGEQYNEVASIALPTKLT